MTAYPPARLTASALCSLALAALLGLPGTACADAARYPPVVPGVELRFPADEGSHPAFRIEWWYVTGWLEAAGEPRPLGFQVTFFRVRPGLGEDNPSRFAPRQVLFGHAALAEPAAGRLRHAERAAREGFGLAFAREGRVGLRLEDWTLEQSGDAYAVQVEGSEFAMSLRLERRDPPLLQGERGFSRKGPDPRSASYYYSLPQLAVTGEVVVEGRRRRVTGQAWFDHEWSSDYVSAGAVGWDWTGINLADGGALMAFRMRDGRGGERWAGATLRARDGTVTTYGPDAVEWQPGRRWRSPRTGAEYPVEWRLRVGERHFAIVPLMDDAELDSRSSTGTIYWEGPVRLLEAAAPGGGSGPAAATPAREAGRGYLELTGYAGPLDL